MGHNQYMTITHDNQHCFIVCTSLRLVSPGYHHPPTRGLGVKLASGHIWHARVALSLRTLVLFTTNRGMGSQAASCIGRFNTASTGRLPDIKHCRFSFHLDTVWLSTAGHSSLTTPHFPPAFVRRPGLT